MSSKRYVVFSNDQGTNTQLVEFEWPEDESKSSPSNYLSPIGVAYDHQNDGKVGYAVGNNIVGKPLSGNPEISDLVGKILTIADAMFVDKDQREAFKSLLKQTIYGYVNDKEEQVRQVYEVGKSQLSKRITE